MADALRPAHAGDWRADALLATLRVGRDIGLLSNSGRTGEWRRGRLGRSWTLGELALRRMVRRSSQVPDLVRRALLAKAVDDITSGQDALRCGRRPGLATGPGSGQAAFSVVPGRAGASAHGQRLSSYVGKGPEQWRPFFGGR